MIRSVISWLSKLAGPAWSPECPEAQIELRRAREICWDYGKFRYHLDRAVWLERRFQARRGYSYDRRP